MAFIDLLSESLSLDFVCVFFSVLVTSSCIYVFSLTYVYIIGSLSLDIYSYVGGF